MMSWYICIVMSRKSRQISTLWSFAAVSLLAVYAASSLRLDSIHQLFHAENITELHSVEKEGDPCHKNIYHQQKASGCEHKSHIIQNTKCPVCEYNNTNPKEFFPDQSDVTQYFESTELKIYFQEGHSSNNCFCVSGRGPPCV